jgi:hypothetical protein
LALEAARRLTYIDAASLRPLNRNHMPRGDLFPDIAPFETGLLPLGDGHVMYWEQVGNPRGQPVLSSTEALARARARCIAASSTPRIGG